MKSGSRYLTLRGDAYSFLVSRRALWITAALFAAVLLLIVICTAIGSVWIPPLEVLRSLFGSGADSSELIVRSLRLPRVIVAVLVGAALAVSGALLQGVIRNPLASPDTIGITGGATLGAVSFFFFLSERAGIAWLPVSAVLGAILAMTLVYVLSWKNGGITPLRLVLIGIGFSAAMSALSYMMMLTGPIVVATKSLTFMAGSIYGVSWEKDVLPLLPYIAVLLPLILLYSRHINIQELGEEVARSVGSAVQRQRLLLILFAVALAGAASAFGGAIPFIGLMAPHMARKLVGPSFGSLLPVSALLGALILLLADLAGRMLFAPLDIPAGVFTAAVGAPFFVYLMYRHRSR